MLHKRHTVTRITQLQKYHSDQNATQIIDKKHERLPPVEIRSHPSSGNKEDNFGVTPPVEIRSHPQWKLRVTPPVEIRKITYDSGLTPTVEICMVILKFNK